MLQVSNLTISADRRKGLQNRPEQHPACEHCQPVLNEQACPDETLWSNFADGCSQACQLPLQGEQCRNPATAAHPPTSLVTLPILHAFCLEAQDQTWPIDACGICLPMLLVHMVCLLTEGFVYHGIGTRLRLCGPLLMCSSVQHICSTLS